MSNHLSVVLNGRTYTRSGKNWVDEQNTLVPTFLSPVLDAALVANADSRASLPKESGTRPRRGSEQRVKRKRKG